MLCGLAAECPERIKMCFFAKKSCVNAWINPKNACISFLLLFKKRIITKNNNFVKIKTCQNVMRLWDD